MRIVFMGTPEIAKVSLETLYNTNHEIVAVFTQPDKPVGRKQILTPPPVKVCAALHGTPVYQPTTLKNGEAYEILQKYNPDIIVVVAYGKILPKEILNLPKFGCINAHASVLPEYRGASPIQWCLVCGAKQTGVTTMFLDEGMDTGDIIEIEKTDIPENENADSLYNRLSAIASNLLVSTLSKIQNGTAKRIKQDDSAATYAPIITKEMSLLDFSKDALTLHNAVRGFYSWPTAHFFLGGKRVKVFETRVSALKGGKCGTVLKADDSLVISCGNNTALEILNLQMEGSKQMPAKAFLTGKKLEIGSTVN